MQMCDDNLAKNLRIANLVSITLFAEKQLATKSKVLLDRVAADQRVEVGLVATGLGPQNPPQPLRFLLTRAESARYLIATAASGKSTAKLATFDTANTRCRPDLNCSKSSSRRR